MGTKLTADLIAVTSCLCNKGLECYNKASSPCPCIVLEIKCLTLPVPAFSFCSDGLSCVDSGWLTCQTEIRLRLHYSKAAPVSITKKKFKKSRFR